MKTVDAEEKMEPLAQRRATRLEAIAQAEERYRLALEAEKQQNEELDIISAQRALAQAGLRKRASDPKAHWQNTILNRDPISKVTKYDQENVKLTSGALSNVGMATRSGIMEIEDDLRDCPIDPALRAIENNYNRNSFEPIGSQL